MGAWRLRNSRITVGPMVRPQRHGDVDCLTPHRPAGPRRAAPGRRRAATPTDFRAPAPSSMERYMQHRSLVPLAVLVSATLLSACGGSPTASNDAGGSQGNDRDSSDLAQAAKKVYDKYNGMSGQQRTDELVKCAEEEGQLN